MKKMSETRLGVIAGMTALAIAMALVAGSATAATQYLGSGARNNPATGGWTLPDKGACFPVEGAAITTRAECIATRFPSYVDSAACTAAKGSWPSTTPSNLCVDTVNNTVETCVDTTGKDRVWSGGVCTLTMKGYNRNSSVCANLGGTWTPTSLVCLGAWVMPDSSTYIPPLVTGTTNPSVGDQCLRCHRSDTEWNSVRIRDVESFTKTGHMNMARPVTAGARWAGPDGALYPKDGSGNTYDWDLGRFNYTTAAQYTSPGVYNLRWIYGDWLAPEPRTIYEGGSYTGGTNVGKPVNSYSCGRCHTTGWTSDAAIATGKEPERTFSGVTWDGTTLDTFGKVNLAGSVTGDTNKNSSWDVWGISCTRCHGSAVDNASNGGVPPFTAPAGMSYHQNGMTVFNYPGSCTVSNKRDRASCEAAGGTWNYGYCTDPRFTAMTQCQDAANYWPTAGYPGSPVGAWVTPCSINTYGNQVACETNGGTWTEPATTSCSVAGPTDLFSCMDAGGHWTGNFTQRGQRITALCMDCHRQETGGLPYDSGANPAGLIKVGPRHESMEFGAHFFGNHFLNSPHARFSGTFAEVATGNVANGKYQSNFMNAAEAAGTGNGCTGCHNVHKSVVHEANPAGGAVKECGECHTEISMSAIRHNGGPGTPNSLGAEACVSCHMPENMHVFRINTDAAYSPFPASAFALSSGTVNAATAADGTYGQAVWVDVDLACGQCHGGGTANATTTGTIASASKVLTVADATGFVTGARVRIAGAYNHAGEPAEWDTYVASVAGTTVNLVGKAGFAVTGAAVELNPTANGAPYYTKAALAQVAKGIHASAATTYQVTFGATPTGLTLATSAVVNCGELPCSSSFTYDWTWGDGNSDLGGTATGNHTYALEGSYKISLDVKLSGLSVGKVSRTIRVTAPDLAPTVDGTLTWNANTWTATLVDASTDSDPGMTTPTPISQIMVDWGDGLKSWGAAGATFTHTYVKPPTAPATQYTIKQTAFDTKPQGSTKTYTDVIAPAYFSIAGNVQNRLGSGLPNATVKAVRTSPTSVVKTVATGAAGAFTIGSLPPGTYTLTVTKAGYTFTSPAATIVVGPSSSANVLAATAP